MLCGSDRPEGPRKPIVFTSIIPHAFFVQQVAGNRVSVRALIKPGGDPHNFTPTAAKVADLSEAKLYFRTGVEFEYGLLSRIRKLPAIPEQSICATALNFSQFLRMDTHMNTTFTRRNTIIPDTPWPPTFGCHPNLPKSRRKQFWMHWS